MAENEETRCDHCGGVDAHPKSHWNTGETFHLDCLPYNLKAQLVDSAPHMEHVINAAVDGTRGDDLHALIKDVHADIDLKKESE